MTISTPTRTCSSVWASDVSGNGTYTKNYDACDIGMGLASGGTYSKNSICARTLCIKALPDIMTFRGMPAGTSWSIYVQVRASDGAKNIRWQSAC